MPKPAALLLGALLLAVLGLAPAAAHAQTKTVTVPGQIVFEHGANPAKPSNCSAAVFAQWKADPKLKVTSATAITFPPEGEYRETREAPFDDTYDWVRVYTAPPGTHRIKVGVSWGDGATPTDCSDLHARNIAAWPNTTARIELTVDTSAECTAAQKRSTKAGKDLLKAQTRLAQAGSARAKRRARHKVASARAAKRRADRAVQANC